MDGLLPERTGVLVIRIWAEGDPARSLRGRITQTLDVADGAEVSTAVATTQDVEAIVHAWLESFVESIEPRP